MPDAEIPVVQFLVGQTAVDQETAAEGLCRGYTEIRQKILIF
jgi:hypothetical protein